MYGSQSNFPSKILIKSNHFIHYFHSDASSNSWGIKFIATPIYSEDNSIILSGKKKCIGNV